MPRELLLDRRVAALARLVYGVLQLMPGYESWQTTLPVALLAEVMQIRPRTARLAVRNLVETGWLQVSRANHLQPIRFTLLDPLRTIAEGEVALAQKRLRQSTFRGEAIMREYLNLIIDSIDFEDNARPGFLVNPMSQERMELDRYYLAGAAFEFNGSQHYGPTDLFSEEQALEQRTRDYIKIGICVTRGISLSVIHPVDLSLASMQRRVPDHLPLRDLSRHQELIAFLEQVSQRYRRAVQNARWSSTGRPLLGAPVTGRA